MFYCVKVEKGLDASMKIMQEDHSSILLMEEQLKMITITIFVGIVVVATNLYEIDITFAEIMVQ